MGVFKTGQGFSFPKQAKYVFPANRNKSFGLQATEK